MPTSAQSTGLTLVLSITLQRMVHKSNVRVTYTCLYELRNIIPCCVCVCVCVCVNFIYNFYTWLIVMFCLFVNALYEWKVTKPNFCVRLNVTGE